MKTLEYILDGASGSEAAMKTPEVILDGTCSCEAAAAGADMKTLEYILDRVGSVDTRGDSI